MKSNRITSAGHSSNTLVSRSQFKPILFSTPMVQALLNGTKRQTRRLMPEWCNDYSEVELVRDPELCDPKAAEWNEIKPKQFKGLFACFDKGEEHLKCKYDIGDILWVRETWNCISHLNPTNTEFEYYYKADEGNEFQRWKPSIFMPKEACRLFLEVTEIRPQKLQRITPEDAQAEGIEHLGGDIWKDYMNKKVFPEFMYGSTLTRTQSFQSLWEKINGVESWESNPFVWAYSFNIVECLLS